MKTTVERQIRRDCVRWMLPCFALHFFNEMFSLTLPVVTSWMIGGMADALLALDTARIRARLFVFIPAFLAGVLAQPLTALWENLLLTRRGFGYGNFLFGRYLRLPMKSARSLDAATLVRRLDTDSTDYYFILMSLCTRPLSMAVYLAVLCAAFVSGAFDPLFILVMALLAALPVWRAALNARAKAKLRADRMDYEEAREGLEYAMLSGRDFLGGYGLTERYIGRLHAGFSGYCEKAGRRQDAFDGMDALFSCLCTYGVPLGVIAAGALMLSRGSLGVGALLTGVLVMPTVTRFYQLLEELILQLREEAVVRKRLEIFYAGRDPAGKAPPVRALRLEGVRFAYPGGEPVLEGADLTLDLGKKIRLTGPNGCGKSTVLGILSGVYAPDAGRVTDGRGRALSAGELRALTAAAEQDGHIFSGTAAENLFVPEGRLPRAAELLGALGFEKPLDYEIRDSGGNLSPGERKKLCLVRALMKPAPVLLLDEPENHLDASARAGLKRLLAADGRPLIYASHSAPLIADSVEIRIK